MKTKTPIYIFVVAGLLWVTLPRVGDLQNTNQTRPKSAAQEIENATPLMQKEGPAPTNHPNPTNITSQVAPNRGGSTSIFGLDGALRKFTHANFPYAEMVGVLESRQAGAYAAVRSMLDLCRSAFIAVASNATGRVSESGTAADTQKVAYGQVITPDQARQEIISRCGPVLGDRRFDSPLPGDVHGDELIKLLNRLNGAGVEELSVLYSEGRIDLSTLVRGLMASKSSIYFDGARFGGLKTANEYQAALEYGGLTLSFDPNAKTPNLTSLLICARDGKCLEPPEHIVLSDGFFPAERQHAIQVVGKQIAGALQRNQISRFFSPGSAGNPK